ncbi:3095_t:CDS:1, partial [Funneliformis mosseae]
SLIYAKGSVVVGQRPSKIAWTWTSKDWDCLRLSRPRTCPGPVKTLKAI